MGKLVYSTVQSLDGYIADENGDFGWAAPDEELHGLVNDIERDTGTMLLGRRTYEILKVWDTFGADDSEPEVIQDFHRIWKGADKIVYSRTLDSVDSERTRLEGEFDVAAVRELKESADRDLTIGGPALASHALAAGLVDVLNIYVVPAIIGGGLRALPDGVRLNLALADQRRTASGALVLRYDVQD